MRTCKWMFTAFLLITLSAVAQQSANQSSSSPPQADAAATQPATTPTQPASAATTNPASGQSTAAASAAMAPPTTMDQVVDRTILREHGLMELLKTRTPLVETYLQNLKADPKLGAVPSEDHYFLGRLDLGESIDRRDYLSRDESFEKNLLGGVSKLFKFEYKPMGFSWMIFADRDDFDRGHYTFKYVRREFLGDVRCLVFDITPKKDAGKGRFLGRIWVEDQDYNIVRLNGTYAPRPRNAFYFHMDSWRLNLIPGYWVPAYIYSEEGDFSYGAKDKMAFKAQSRIWGYDLKKGGKEDELTSLRVDSVKDETPSTTDASPLEAQRQWQQQAEDNVVERLQESGLVAPDGEVDKVLQTVVNNLIVTNNIDLPRPVRTRVMITSPLETFSVGNTIVGSKFAFNDRMLFSDESTYNNFGFRHNPDEETAADAKAMELLKNSPYAQKLDVPSLFLKELSERAPSLNALLTAHLGNSFTNDKGQLVRLSALATTGPALDANKLDQIAALPMGGRVKLNAWTDRVELTKSAPVAITSARDKMPFEVTPFFPRLSRLTSDANTGNAASASNTAPSN